MVAITILIALAGLFNGAADSLQFHFKRSFARSWNPLFWNPSQSWRNKYKNGDPEQGRRFFGSTTFLVLFTDAWHLIKFAQMACFRLAVVLLLPFAWYWLIGSYFGLWAIQAAAFHIPYTLLKQKQ